MTVGNPPLTQRDLYELLREELSRLRVENAAGEARFMTEELLGLPGGAFLSRTPVPSEMRQRAQEWVRRRGEGYPLQYLFGHWPFMDLEFSVGPGVLIPRQDTETVCEAAMRQLSGKQAPVVADLCAGSGCIACTIAHHRPDAQVFAVEKDGAARSFLERNVADLAPQVHVLAGDVLDRETAKRIPPADLIVSNPPYLTRRDMEQLQREVTFEPAVALDGGADGLLFYREITALWKDALKPGGVLLFEAGAGQSGEIKEILVAHGFSEIQEEKDLGGIVRAMWGCIEKETEIGYNKLV